MFVEFAATQALPFQPPDWRPSAWLPLPAPPELVAAFIDYYSPPNDRQAASGVALYKADAVRAPATMRRYLATIGKAHRIHGLEDPTKDELVRDTARTFFRGRGAYPAVWAETTFFSTATAGTTVS